MPFQKGQPRHENAGRKKGSKNKKKIARVAEFLAEKNINPAQEILNLINGVDEMGKPLLNAHGKLMAWFDLLSYCQGKPKAEDEGGGGGESGEQILDQFEGVTDETLLKLAAMPTHEAS